MKVILLIILMLLPFQVSSLTLAKRYPESISTEIGYIATAIESFRKDTGRYPSTAEGLDVLVDGEASDLIQGYRTSGYLRPAARDGLLPHYGYMTTNIDDHVVYYIWRKDSEARLGYVAGRWSTSPNEF